MRLFASKSQLLVCTLIFVALNFAEVFPAAARVDQRSGMCFERLITGAKITRNLGKCTIYVGTVGFDRVLWGFQFPNGRKINAWSAVSNDSVMVNDMEGYYYSPSGRSADTLRKGQYFCLGLKGDNRMTCGRKHQE
jgi:hypothetical protein